jgi:hypothetical protein
VGSNNFFLVGLSVTWRYVVIHCKSLKTDWAQGP